MTSDAVLYRSRQEIGMTNYFNTQIIERHDDHMWLNNSMAECYDFCQNIAEIVGNEIDAKWWYTMKKGHLCYDV